MDKQYERDTKNQTIWMAKWWWVSDVQIDTYRQLHWKCRSNRSNVSFDVFCNVLFRKIFWMIATFSWNEHRLFQTVWDNCCSCKWVVYFCFANDDNKECKGNVQVCMQFIYFFSIFTAHVSSHTNIEHGPFRQSSKSALHTWKPRWLMQILNNKTKEKQKQTIEKAFSLCFYVFQKSIINLTHTHTRNICWVVINNVRFWTHND